MHHDRMCYGTKRTLAPVLVAKVYNQTIIEEIPNSAMSMRFDNTATITQAHSDGCCDHSYVDDSYNEGGYRTGCCDM